MQQTREHNSDGSLLIDNVTMNDTGIYLPDFIKEIEFGQLNIYGE